MAQSARKIQNAPPKKTQKEAGDNRLLILPTGYFGFLGKSACKALGITASKAKKTPARDILHFASEEDSLASSPFTESWVQTIRSGVHTLLNKKGEEISFQFDSLPSNGIILVVASYIENGVVSEDVPLTQWIEETLVSTHPHKKALQDNTIQDTPNAQTFLDLSNDLMVTCTLNGLFKSVNERFTLFLGYDQTQLPKLSFIDIIHPEDRAHIHPILMNIAKGEVLQNKMIDFEARIVSREGKIYPMEWRLKTIGQDCYMVGQDLSAMKSHEQTLINHQDYLSEAQAIGHMGHWTWHMDTHTIEWSDEIYRIFGVNRENFTPSIDIINKRLHRRDIGRSMHAFQRALIEKRDYEMEFSIKRPSGEERFIKCQGRCKLDKDGEVISLFGIMQDITGHIEHEKELRDAKESVERAYAAKSQFLANMSHELRTPLNAIIGFSEMIQSQMLGPIGTEKYLEYINGIHESGAHLLDLISDILDMSKIEAGKYELTYETVEMSTLIQRSLQMMEGRALDKHITLKTDMKEEDITLTADRRALTQILLNLLSNAVKFTPDNGEVTLSCVTLNDKIKLTIQDNGIGIPAMKLNSITNPFEQVSSEYTRDHDGSGLGLAITKELVELHNATLTIESQINVGTNVTLLFPQTQS